MTSLLPSLAGLTQTVHFVRLPGLKNAELLCMFWILCNENFDVHVKKQAAFVSIESLKYCLQSGQRENQCNGQIEAIEHRSSQLIICFWKVMKNGPKVSISKTNNSKNKRCFDLETFFFLVESVCLRCSIQFSWSYTQFLFNFTKVAFQSILTFRWQMFNNSDSSPTRRDIFGKLW